MKLQKSYKHLSLVSPQVLRRYNISPKLSTFSSISVTFFRPHLFDNAPADPLDVRKNKFTFDLGANLPLVLHSAQLLMIYFPMKPTLVLTKRLDSLARSLVRSSTNQIGGGGGGGSRLVFRSREFAQVVRRSLESIVTITTVALTTSLPTLNVARCNLPMGRFIFGSVNFGP